MKILILLFAILTLPSYALEFGMSAAESIANLKTWQVETGSQIFILGKTTPGDGLGGFYRWDETDSTSAEDMTNLNIIKSDRTNQGRWKRVFQRSQSLPQGLLVTNGPLKTLYVSTTTLADGTATIYLTMDGTSTGTPIFTEIKFNDSKASYGATNPSSAVQSFFMTESLVSTKHGYYKANAITLTLALVTGGLLLNPLISVGAGVPVRFRVEGI